MGKPPTETELIFRPDPNRHHPPIDSRVKLPRQILPGAKTRAKIPYTDAEISGALERCDQGILGVSDPEFGIIIELARHGARMIKANRQGARKERKTSAAVTMRLEILIQSYSELSPKRQAQATGRQTIEQLRKAIIGKLGIPDGDNVVSEETIRQDIRLVRPILRLIEKKKIPPSGDRHDKEAVSEQTRMEMEAGKAALAKGAARAKVPKKPIQRRPQRDL